MLGFSVNEGTVQFRISAASSSVSVHWSFFFILTASASVPAIRRGASVMSAAGLVPTSELEFGVSISSCFCQVIWRARKPAHSRAKLSGLACMTKQQRQRTPFGDSPCRNMLGQSRMPNLSSHQATSHAASYSLGSLNYLRCMQLDSGSCKPLFQFLGVRLPAPHGTLDAGVFDHERSTGSPDPTAIERIQAHDPV